MYELGGIVLQWEKVVSIRVNGAVTPLQMKLGSAGEAFFVVPSSDDASLPLHLATSPINSPPTSPGVVRRQRNPAASANGESEGNAAESNAAEGNAAESNVAESNAAESNVEKSNVRESNVGKSSAGESSAAAGAESVAGRPLTAELADALQPSAAEPRKASEIGSELLPLNDYVVQRRRPPHHRRSRSAAEPPAVLRHELNDADSESSDEGAPPAMP